VCFLLSLLHCCSIKFETNFSPSSLKLEPCDECLILTFLKAPESLKFPETHNFVGKVETDAEESINHKTPNNDSMGSLLLYVQLLLFRTLENRVYHCW
jgi:hypothetical protein